MPRRVMSGMRPTGPLHLGHWLGVLKNWVSLQQSHECYFMIADWHALTTGADRQGLLRQHVRDVLLDWLSCGIDPDRAVCYVQSTIPEIAELYLLLGMLTPVGWLQRNPTVKEQAQELAIADDQLSMGLLSYPVLQTADILLFRGEAVPVGKDQLPHLELSRDLARRFNHMFGEVFKEPQGLLTPSASLPGTDGRKMSKSYGNDIKLSDDAASTKTRVMSMVTDPARQRRTDPGTPEVCTVYAYYHALAPEQTEEVAEGCRKGTLGCVACKQNLAAALETTLEPIRSRRSELERDPDALTSILIEGQRKARAEARHTIDTVREAMKLHVQPQTASKYPG